MKQVFYNSRSKQKIKKNPTYSFANTGNFEQKILNFMAVGARQSFQFFRKIPWFLGKKGTSFKFECWILHHLISNIKSQND